MTEARKKLPVTALAVTVMLALALGGLGLTSLNATPAFAADGTDVTAAPAANTVKVKYKGTAGAKNANPTDVKKGATLKLKKASKPGYTFKGWYQGKKKVTKVKVTKATTLTAKWEPKTYKIKYKNVKGTNKNAKTFKYGKTVKLKSLSKKGYTFLGWYSDKYFTSKKLSKVGGKVAKNETVYARWIENPRTAREKQLVKMANKAYAQLPSDEYTNELLMTNALKQAGATDREARFVAKNCKANYYVEAVKCVKYLKEMPELQGFEGDELAPYVRTALINAGFTKSQADYALKVVKL